MRLSLSEISTVGASFAEDVEAYAAAGFDGIGIWEFKLPEDDEQNRALLRDAGLGVATCVPTVPSILPLGIPGMEGPPDPEERIEALCRSVTRLAAYEPGCVLCLTGPCGDRDADDARHLVIDGLRAVARAGVAAGVRVALEPIHPTQRDDTSFLNGVVDAWELLRKAGLEFVLGMMVDTYNLADDPQASIWLGTHLERVFGLHVADWPADESAGRVLPRPDGRSRAFVDVLREAGWDGYLDVEIFSTPEGFWSLPVDEAARRAHAAAAALVE